MEQLQQQLHQAFGSVTPAMCGSYFDHCDVIMQPWLQRLAAQDVALESSEDENTVDNSEDSHDYLSDSEEDIACRYLKRVWHNSWYNSRLQGK